MKTAWKRLSIMLGMIVVGVFLGALLITLAYCIPVNQKNAQSSITSLNNEDWYPSATQLSSSLDTYFHSYLPGVLDGGTDGLMLDRATKEIQGNPLYEAMDMEGYTYYWHGYVVILRILLFFIDYEQFRFLNCALQLLMVFLLAHFLWEKKGQRYAMVMLSAYILLMPMAMSLSLQFSWIFYITMIASLLICYCNSWCSEQRIPYIFLGIGILTSFIDLLTYPLYTWAFPLLIFLLLKNGEKAGQYVKTVISSGFSWILGYAGMWFGKWVLAGWVVKRNVMQEAWEEVLFRSGSTETMNIFTRLSALYQNWKHYEYPLYMALLFLWLLWFIYKSLKKGTQMQRNEKNDAYLLITASAFVWYFVLANHTLGHHFFTYRIWGIAISSVLFLLCESIVPQEEGVSKKSRLCLVIQWGILLILSVGMTLTAREDIDVLNGGVEYQEVELEEGSQVEEEFIPTYPTVKQFSMGIRTDSKIGHCIIEVQNDGKTLYELELELAQVSDSCYETFPVNWKFKKGKNYEIVIYAEGNETPVYLRFTKDNVNPMMELGTAEINGEIISGQLTSGVVYSYRPLSKRTLIFLTISWLGLFAALSLEVKQIVMRVFYRLKGKSGSV